MLAANAIVNATADRAIIDGAVSNRRNLVFFISDTSQLYGFRQIGRTVIRTAQTQQFSANYGGSFSH